MIRIGVDIGGTFTDLVLDDNSAVTSVKILTTPAAPEQAVREGLGRLLSDAGIRHGDVGLIIHGTTLATNAIIERKGARTAFVTTAGHRDVLEIRAEDRFDLFDLGLRFPAPLVPREWRFAVRERIDATGAVLLPLDESELDKIAGALAAAEIESVAVGFLHSYAEPSHERLAAARLARRLPDVSISLSSDVSPQMREFERFSTVCANAYVKPRIARYLNRLRDELRADGFACPVLMMLSSGGLATIETAIAYPVRLVESGPAGGAVFAARIAADYGLRSATSFDMGGTTAKICLVENGALRNALMFEAARGDRFRKGSGLPLRIPVIEMVEIGAGGGSIAAFDGLGRLQVGPASAGSEPGPVCYGRGGSEPTVTDADLCLGRIDPEAFAGGRIRLDAATAREALGARVAERLGCDPAAAAAAVSELVEENMANAARVHAAEQGQDLAAGAIIAFGGAAGLHVCRIAEKIGADRIIVPRFAGVGSAMGFLQADVAYEIVRSYQRRLDELDAAALRALLAEMTSQADAIVRAAAPDADRRTGIVAFMRYVGQGHEVRTELPDLAAVDRERLADAFLTTYERRYDRRVPDGVIEIVACSVMVAARGPAPGGPLASPTPVDAVPSGRRRVASLAVPQGEEIAVYHRSDLAPGACIRGPGIVVEDETSILIGHGFTAQVDGRGAIDCRRDGGRR